MHTFTLAHFGALLERRHTYAESIGWIAFGLALLTGATSTTFAKQLTQAFSPMSMVFLSEFSVLCFSILSFGFLPLVRSLSCIKKRHIIPLVIFSVCNGIAAPILVFHGLQYTSAVNAELYLRSQTIFLLLFAALYLKEKIQREHFLAVTVVIAGIMIVALKGFTASVTLGRGDLLIIGGAALYALGTSIMKSIINATHPEAAIFFRGVVAMGFFFVSAPFMHHTFTQELTQLQPALFATVIGYGFISCFLSLFCFYEAVEHLPAHTISVGLPLMSIGSIIFASFYLGEPLKWYHMVGAVMLVSGTIMMRMADRKHGHEQRSEIMPHYQRHG